MEKSLKVPLMMLTLMLSIFLAAGAAGAFVCDGTFNDVNDCGCEATADVTFSADVTCSTRHGIVIGAAGITIDGAGFKLSGAGTAMTSRNCAVNVAPEELADRIWCEGHPCRRADVSPADSDDTTFNGCLDSGVINAVTTLGGGVTGAQMCEGGFDNVTVKDLEITGFCDGIFMSGDCTCAVVEGGRTACATSSAGSEYRLTGILIEGNYIHDNGNGDCGTYLESDGGDGGEWTSRFYNDAIFLAQVGSDGVGTAPPVCADVLPEDLNSVIMNVIHEQKGCACVSCPGGSGINLNGGIEAFDENDVFTGTWTGCDEIAENRVRGCDVSGIMYHHAVMYTRIHGNDLTRNLFCGIANGCGWCNDQYVYDNVAKQNFGTGIAVNAATKIKNNICTHTRPATGEQAEIYQGFASNGHGIVTGEPGSEVKRNQVYANAGTDIRFMNVNPAESIDNMCVQKAADPFSNCNSVRPWKYNVCWHDVNNGPLGDGMVTYASDGNAFIGTVYDFNWGMPMRPKCWLINGQ